jgi:hypothetical protein
MTGAPPCQGLLAKTRAAVALTTINVGVLWRELVTPLAVSLSRVSRRATCPAQHVCSARDDLKVRGIDAMTHSAKMVELHPLWDWTNEQLV